jgi:hypothetical protein
VSAGDVRPARRGLAPVDRPDHLRSVTGTGTQTVPLTVADLCADFAGVCESAVDPLEIASALEFDGLSDRPRPTRGRPAGSSRCCTACCTACRPCASRPPPRC